MPEQSGTLETIGAFLGRLVSPLEEMLTEGQVLQLFAELGMQFPEVLETKTAFMNALQNTATAARRIPQKLITLAIAIKDEDEGSIISVGLELFNDIKDTITSIETIGTELNNLNGALPGVNPGELATFSSELPTRLIDYLVIRNLEAVPMLAETLEFVGAIERQNIVTANLGFTKRKLKLDEFISFLQSPGEQLKNIYHWGANDFDGTLLLQKLEKFLVANSYPAILITTGPAPVLDAFFGDISAKTDINPPGLQIIINEPISIENSAPITQDDWKLEFDFHGQLTPNVQIIIQPNGNMVFQPPEGDLEGGAAITWTGGKQDGEPYILLGMVGGSRLEVRHFIAKAGVDFVWSSADGKAEGGYHFSGKIKEGKVVIDFSQGDGFLSEILSGVGLESDFDLGLGFSSQNGIYFTGSVTLDIQLPMHVNLGPVELSALTINIGFENLNFPIGLSANIKANLGPLTAVVEQIGLKTDLSLPPDRKGNIGPVDLSFGFKPPKGVGLAIEAGVVKGGGYLYFDYDREEYAGVLELVFSEWIALKAIGMITTKMPDGSKGFSLLIIITAEFGSGIQLGLGFTLLGVGGLLGLNRIVNIESVKEGIRTGAIESVMFPQDVVANAPKIISDLRKFFPVQLDIFLIGPMAKIGWGTPALVSVQMGLILEFPSVNITILGVVKVVLPDEDADILRLQVNFVGRLEPSNSLLWFYAELYDSRVLFITLEGGFGLLVNWGDNTNFVISAGGFHPRFNPPPLPFPEPPRIAANILNESYAKIRIEGYFAVTSNSVQFGARAELYFGLSEFRIEGHLGFDALFQFNPFYFNFSLSVSLSVKVFGIGLFSVGFKGMFEGPTPWHIKGKGKISLLFFSIKVPFEHTWGPSQDTKLEPIDVFPILEKEFDALTNWEARLPASNNLLVSLRKMEKTDDDQLVLHPVGKLRVSQRKVPINIKLDKVGNQRPADVNEINVAAALPGSPVTITIAKEKFAIGQFKDWDSSKQLSSPAFEPLESGVEIGVAGEQLKTSQGVRRVIRYETWIIDNNYKEHSTTVYEFLKTGFALIQTFLFSHFLKNSAVKQSVLSQNYKKRLQPFEEVTQVQPTGYTIVTITDNRPVDTIGTSYTSQAQAQGQLEQLVSSDPGLANSLQVIPSTEVNITT